MTKLLLCAGLAALIAHGAVAQDAPPQQPPAPPPAPQAPFLQRNVKLDFKLLPLGENDHGTYVVTASPAFATNVRYKRPESTIELQTSGNIQLLDDGRVFVTYQMHLVFEGDAAEATYGVSSSVVLKSGQEQEVANIGEKTLVIRATLLDAPPPAGPAE